MVKFGNKFYICCLSLSKCVYNLFKQKKKCHTLYLIILIVFVVEVLTYYYVAFLWYPIKCANRNKCTKILLVADPQLIGLQNEPLKILTPISIWDSDWYLSKTYRHALAFSQPNIVIFLGDLFDEGSTATDGEFWSYFKRFQNIFQKDNVQYIWVSGDNDIGGEYADFITSHKIERFMKAFPQEDVVTYKNVRFNIINRLTYQMPMNKHPESKENYTEVVLSHLNLLAIPTLFVEKVLDTIHPKIVLTAHTHKAKIISMNENTRSNTLITTIQPDNTKVYNYDLNDKNIIEIVVPTCSYRMGTTKIGYGFAVLESNILKYTVLWTPSRFLQLLIYAIFAVILVFYCVLCRCCCSFKKTKPAQYSILERNT